MISFVHRPVIIIRPLGVRLTKHRLPWAGAPDCISHADSNIQYHISLKYKRPPATFIPSQVLDGPLPSISEHDEYDFRVRGLPCDPLFHIILGCNASSTLRLNNLYWDAMHHLLYFWRIHTGMRCIIYSPVEKIWCWALGWEASSTLCDPLFHIILGCDTSSTLLLNNSY